MLIVDDEIHIASGIKMSLAWEELGISQVHMAYNIRQAKEVFATCPIDVLICDIEMPGGNGLELLAWVKEQFPATECIFVTCHADFSYAKKAIQLGCLEYLLKPVEDEELKSIVVKAIHKIRKEREDLGYLETYRHYYELWSSHQPLLAEKFWLDLLNRKISSHPDAIQQAIQNLTLPYSGESRFLPILISVRRWDKELSKREEQIMEYALLNSAKEMILNNEAHAQVVPVNRGDLLCLLPVPTAVLSNVNAKALKYDCEKYTAACNKYFYCHLSCFVGTAVFIHEVVAAYEALVAVRDNNITGVNKVFLLEDHVNGASAKRIDLPNMSVWCEWLKRGAQEKLVGEVLEFLESLKQMEGLDVKVLQEFHHYFLQMVYKALQFEAFQAHQVFSESVSAERSAVAVRSVMDLAEWAQEMIGKAMDHIREIESTENAVEKVKRYISTNLDQDISRDDLAGYIGLHPDYIAKLFKKETGLSISEYVIQARIEIAKDLLVKTDMSISNIALHVGYSNFSYFSTVFKKTTQMNPQEFRKWSTGR
nr:response regulator [Paenibacillus hamazuiensis]